MDFDPPITMPHPDALIAAAEHAESLDRLRVLFEDVRSFALLHERGLAFLSAIRGYAETLMEGTDMAEIRRAAEGLTLSHRAFSEATPQFFRDFWCYVIDRALGDPSGQSGRQALDIFRVRDASSDHVRALWEITRRSSRWEEVLSSDPVLGFPRYMNKAIRGKGKSLAVPDYTLEQTGAESPVGSAEAPDDKAIAEETLGMVLAIAESDLTDDEWTALQAAAAGDTPTEIALRLAIEPNNARQILYRARKKIAAAL